jgi:hypothetical protein
MADTKTFYKINIFAIISYVTTSCDHVWHYLGQVAIKPMLIARGGREWGDMLKVINWQAFLRIDENESLSCMHFATKNMIVTTLHHVE